MTRRLLAVAASTALAVACQTQTPVSKTTAPLPPSSAPSASVAPTFVPPTASATFVPGVYLQMHPDTVHVWSSGPGQFPSLDRTVSDRARVTGLLQMAAQLQVAAPGRFCPIDFGYAYTLEWSEGGRLVAEGSLQAQGCRQLRLDNGPSLETTREFWNALADVLGVPEASLHPTPSP